MMVSFSLIFLAYTIFGLLHTLLASLWMKAWVDKYLGVSVSKYYRLFYNLVSVILLGGIFWIVIHFPSIEIYVIPSPLIYLTLLIQTLAALSLLAALAQTGLSAFLGLNQLGSLQKIPPSDTLKVTGFYRWIRHPIYTFGLFFLWLIPLMNLNILAFNLATTLYIFVGIYFEERKLFQEFGEEYAEYRHHTSMLIPPFL